MPIPRVIRSVIEVQANAAAPRAHDGLRAVRDAGACVLAAADVFHALGEPNRTAPRSSRPPRTWRLRLSQAAGASCVGFRFPRVLPASGRPGVG